MRDHPELPCPFLENNMCSVYSHRPIACRTHLLIGGSPELCERVPGHAVDVPYMDTRDVWAKSLQLQGDELVADIRDFFPELDSRAPLAR